MQAMVKKENEIVYIHLIGKLDLSKTQELKRLVFEKFRNQKIVFHLGKSHFVGSTGITTFLQSVEELDQVTPFGVRIFAAGIEFKRLIEGLELKKSKILDSLDNVNLSFTIKETYPVELLVESSIHDSVSQDSHDSVLMK